MTQTTAPTFAGVAGLSGELHDALTAALTGPPDPRSRAAVICTLIQEMCGTVECLQESETGQGRATDRELTSLRQLVAAAYDHRWRMTFGAGAPGAGSP